MIYLQKLFGSYYISMDMRKLTEEFFHPLLENLSEIKNKINLRIYVMTSTILSYSNTTKTIQTLGIT
jgi:hypothetical protein